MKKIICTIVLCLILNMPAFAKFSEDVYDRYANNDDYNGAINYCLSEIDNYNRQIPSNPNNDVLYYERGLAQKHLKFAVSAAQAYDYFNENAILDNAFADFTTAINLKPKALYYADRAEFFELRPFYEVLADYDKAIELAPNESNYYYLRASHRMLKSIGTADPGYVQMKKALEDLNKAISIAPEEDELYYLQRARVKHVLGYNPENIRQDIKKAKDILIKQNELTIEEINALFREFDTW